MKVLRTTTESFFKKFPVFHWPHHVPSEFYFLSQNKLIVKREEISTMTASNQHRNLELTNLALRGNSVPCSE